MAPYIAWSSIITPNVMIWKPEKSERPPMHATQGIHQFMDVDV
jgi:hypothetical protein